MEDAKLEKLQNAHCPRFLKMKIAEDVTIVVPPMHYIDKPEEILAIKGTQVTLMHRQAAVVLIKKEERIFPALGLVVRIDNQKTPWVELRLMGRSLIVPFEYLENYPDELSP